MAVPATYEQALTELSTLAAEADTVKDQVQGSYTSFDASVANLTITLSSVESRLAWIEQHFDYVRTHFG